MRRTSLTQCRLHVVHWWEVEANSRHYDKRKWTVKNEEHISSTCSNHAWHHSSPETSDIVLVHHTPHHPHHALPPCPPCLLLNSGLDKVQWLKQEGGACATQGAGQEGLHHWVGETINGWHFQSKVSSPGRLQSNLFTFTLVFCGVYDLYCPIHSHRGNGSQDLSNKRPWFSTSELFVISNQSSLCTQHFHQTHTWDHPWHTVSSVHWTFSDNCDWL